MSLTPERLLRAVYPPFDPMQTKLHLAQWNGREHPLDVYESGHFEIWQSAQTRPDFNRPLVATLIDRPQSDRWLFGGLWKVLGPPAHGLDPYNVLTGRP